MLRTLVFGIVTWWCFVIVHGFGNAGPGMWSVQYIETCDVEQDKMKIDLIQKKINRTHDAWSGNLKFEDVFDRGYSIHIEICQLVDGGYRLTNEINEAELLDFFAKYADENVKRALLCAGIDPPEFPVQAGEYNMQDFIFDYNELDKQGFYGEYSGKVVVKKGLDEVCCIMGFVEFSEED